MYCPENLHKIFHENIFMAIRQYLDTQDSPYLLEAASKHIRNHFIACWVWTRFVFWAKCKTLNQHILSIYLPSYSKSVERISVSAPRYCLRSSLGRQKSLCWPRCGKIQDHWQSFFSLIFHPIFPWLWNILKWSKDSTSEVSCCREILPYFSPCTHRQNRRCAENTEAVWQQFSLPWNGEKTGQTSE